MTDETTPKSPHLETLAQAAARLNGGHSTPGPEAGPASGADETTQQGEQAAQRKDTSGQDTSSQDGAGLDGAGQEASGTEAGEPSARQQGGQERSAKISEPGKIVRVGTMAQQLLEEVRKTDLDEAGRERLAEIHRRTIEELSAGMSAELIEELKRLDLPFSESETPSIGELRIAQAQLVGWLEGLFHGIQTALMSQQAIAQAQAGQQAGALPRGAIIMGQEDGSESADSGDDAEQRPGNYL
ncbi:proteasome activator [Brevibacterium otitidis]|uniref:Bacterial proteasome activator n=1 Tax=Brevibacterium otitidis TaxID=53364 RepID=A0ABV5X578_9MICO|nr:hypothetical protein GCM10023233_27740 [Brevibacterium otitidis]